MHQAAVDKPHNSCFVFFGAASFSHKAVKEFLVLLCKLRRNTVPQHSNFRNGFIGGVLRKILLVCSQNALLNYAHLSKITVLSETLNSFRHTAHEIIVFQSIDISLFEAGNERKISTVQ